MNSFIKKAWDLSLVHCIQTKDSDKMKMLMSVLKEDKAFGKMYMLVNNLERGIEGDNKYDVDLFIQENRKIARDINLDNIPTINIDYDAIKESYPILQDIENVLFKKVTPFNLSKITESVDNVKKHLISLNEGKKTLNLDVEKLEEQYSSLSDEDKDFLLEFYRTPEENKKTLFESKKNNVLNKLETLLEQVDDNDERLLIFETYHTINKLSDGSVENLVNIYNLEKQMLNESNS
jgi:hypothetical protein